jgi:hypothetical protein
MRIARAKHVNTWSGRASQMLALKRSQCKKQGIDFDLGHEWMLSRLKGSCEMTGVKFKLTKTSSALGTNKQGPKPYGPSIDRINPKLGYTMDNCRMVIWAYNALKMGMTDSQTLEVAEKIVGGLINLKTKRR